MSDIRYALRSLLRAPGFTTVAVLTLAIGIGANTAIFSVINAVLLRPLPYAEPERLVQVETVERRSGNPIRTSVFDFIDLRRDTRSLTGLAAFTGSGFTFTDGEPEMVLGLLVSTNLFDVLGVRPVLGRPFRRDEAEAGHDRVLVLSHGLWQRRFGGNPNIVGRRTLVNGRPYEIVGVMPDSFVLRDREYECLAPLAERGNEQLANRNLHYLSLIGRRKTDASVADASSEVATLARQLEQRYPNTNANLSAQARELSTALTGQARPALLLLLSGVALVLLIACANVTNLLLARSLARRRELAIRRALGAKRSRLVRHILSETAVLYAAGAAVALLLAAWSLDVVLAVAPADIPRLDEISIDGRVLGFTLFVSAATAFFFGLVPALQASKGETVQGLKEGTRGVTAGSERIRTAIVVAEIALSLVLLTGAGLTIRSLVRLLNVDPGFSPEHVATMGLGLPEQRYPDRASLDRFFTTFVQQLQRRTGAASGAVTALPLSGQGWDNPMTPDRGSEAGSRTRAPLIGARGISPGYFAAMGIHLTSGRDVSWSDTLDSPLVVVINEAAARRFWPGETAVGKRLKIGDADSSDPWRTVVGVVRDVRHESLALLPQPQAYFPYRQFDDDVLPILGRGLFVAVRSDADLSTVIAVVKQELAAVDPQLPLRDVRPMTALVSASAGQPRFRTVLLTLFGVTALALAAVGIYGVLAYLVVQRTREIAIRVALGARRREIAAVVARAAGLPILAGVAAGTVLSLWAGRLMKGLLYEVQPADPWTLGAVALLLVACAAVATTVPIVRALRVDPLVALKQAS